MTWQDVRNVLVYPALLAGGIAFALLMIARWRTCAQVEAAWAAAMGVGVALLGAGGLMALAVAHHLGPGSRPGSFVFFLAVAAPAAITIAGALRLFWLMWRGGRD